MQNIENIRFIATVIVIVIFLSLHHFYRHRFNSNSRAGISKITGILILLLSFILAWWWMNR